jgi:hypothetical protein
MKMRSYILSIRTNPVGLQSLSGKFVDQYGELTILYHILSADLSPRSRSIIY